MLLLDASVLLAAEDPDDNHHASAAVLMVGDEPLATLDLAYYESVNVAMRAWRDPAAAGRLLRRIAAIADDAGIVRVDEAILRRATAVADEHGISVYGAAYVAAARSRDCALVSCDLRDLVSRRLAILPGDVGSSMS